MTRIHGKSGSLSFGGLTAGVESWTLTIDDEQEEATSFTEAGSGYHHYISGIGSYKASVSCGVDTTSSVLAKGTTGTLVLTLATGKTYTGTAAIVSNVSINVSATGKETVNYDFNFNCVPSAAWA